ncbi:MAG: HlyD family efflux transporter periplasmic adaptor subunit [Gimesia sp.]|nr:HlyD family efflux transporter periplasmic adaptor subunit [Gimesia sp.]
MIVFLTLCYCLLVAILYKLKIIKMTTGWKLSPLVFMVVCIIFLIFPMQWGAPSGNVNVFRFIVEVVPNVTGQVVEIPARPLEPMKKGDVLFQIDPQPFQDDVKRLEAALKEAQQIAKSLPAALSSAKAEVEQSRAAVLEAKQKVEVMRVELEAANVSVAKYEAQYALSQANFDRTTKLFAKSAVTQSQLDTEQRNLDAAKANLDTEKAKREQTQIKYDSRIGGVNTIVIQAQEDLIMAQAKEAKAQFAVESTINGENTAVAQIHQQLNTAKLKLDWTTVRAPADGYVMQLSLREGQRVTALPMRSWMAYVEKERTRVIVGIRQYQLRHIQPGQSAEIAFKLYPGRTISAKVEAVLNMNATGQIQASGVLEDSDATAREQQDYGVVLVLDDPQIDVAKLPGGAIGSAAIYTEHSKMTHVIRRVELRMNSWMNYILP